MTRRLLRRLALLPLLLFTAAATPVDLELVLAVDSSSSVDAEEFTFQMDGLAAAFRDPSVHAAIESGVYRAIAVTVVEWADTRRQSISIPWVRVDSPESAEAMAKDIETASRLIYGGGTSISGAIGFSMARFGTGAFAGERRVIDVSGDGKNNLGLSPEEARDAAVLAGITVNGLAISNEEPELASYYRERVIGGPGAFVVHAADYRDFARAILEKLLREIGAVPVAVVPEAVKLAHR